MNGRNIDLYALLFSAWDNTLRNKGDTRGTVGKPTGHVHQEASGVWVDCVGREFQKLYNHDNQRVFWKGNKKNRDKFGLNELLFDISVCQVEEVPSISRGTPLPFVSKCHWQVESELNDSDSREITKDLSKLVMGQSDNNLFISSYQGNKQTKIKRMCSRIARRCTGELYLCFIDHPRNWGCEPKSPVLFRWKANSWRLCGKDGN